MAGLIKSTKKGVRRRSSQWIDRAQSSSRAWIRHGLEPVLCYADMLVNDYGLARILYNNQHKIGDDVWRSAQPAPRHIARLASRGLKTVVNLRSDQTVGTRLLEQRACARAGVRLIDVPLKSRAAPTREEFLAIKQALLSAEYPILIHCKSGADRAGLMSVMVRHVHQGVPIEEARQQLSFKFGHIRQAETGVLGHVFETYLADNAEMPTPFWEWVETRYDPEAVNRSFRSTGWANRVVNGLLRRE
jgi:uncharacterized protein (TIGR01244 family)